MSKLNQLTQNQLYNVVKDDQKDYITKICLKKLLPIRAPVTILLIRTTLTKPFLLLLRKLIPNGLNSLWNK